MRLAELAAALVFAIVAAAFVTPRFSAGSDVAALWSALIPLLVVLVQAGAYWLAARSWVEHDPMPAGWAISYRMFRLADAAMLAGLHGVGTVGRARR